MKQQIQKGTVINDLNNVLKSITIFLTTVKDYQNKEVIDLYNDWSERTNIIITEDKVMEQVLRELIHLKDIDIDLLKDAISSY